MNTLNVEYRKVEALIPYARNPRTHADSQIAKIAASIVEYGWTNPILVDGGNGIIAGHGRLAAAHKLGLAEVPVIELAHLSTAQKRAYVIADNRLVLDAGWDEEDAEDALDGLEHDLAAYVEANRATANWLALDMAGRSVVEIVRYQGLPYLVEDVPVMVKVA